MKQKDKRLQEALRIIECQRKSLTDLQVTQICKERTMVTVTPLLAHECVLQVANKRRGGRPGRDTKKVRCLISTPASCTASFTLTLL